MSAQIEEIVLSSPPMLPSVGQRIPKTWLTASSMLRAIRDGRDPERVAKQVLAALEEHRKKRRKATRFGYLVDECSKTESFEEVDVGFSIAAAVAGMKKKGADSSTDTPKAKREAQTEVVTSCLILINSIISNPDVLLERV